MIKSVKFLKDYLKVFKKDESFDFKSGVNLVVGDQGSGKSSLISLIREYKSKKDIIQIEADHIVSLSFCFEKDNPRKQSTLYDQTCYQQLCSLFMSHGETNNGVLERLEKEKDTLFILDEPDTALSIRSCYKLVERFKIAESNGCQIIAIVHNPIIISAFKNVLSLEHRKWMPSRNFILDHEKIITTT